MLGNRGGIAPTIPKECMFSVQGCRVAPGAKLHGSKNNIIMAFCIIDIAVICYEFKHKPAQSFSACKPLHPPTHLTNQTYILIHQ